MISIILPSCHRPKQLRNMLESLRRTTVGYDIEVIALIDDDLESADIATDHGCILDYSNERRGVLSLWNKGLQICSGNYIHPAMDDLIYHENWLEYGLRSHVHELGGFGVIGFNDLAYNGNTQVATQFIFDRRYCKKHMGGVIAPPVYNYLWIDVEINEKAKLVDCFYWDERAIVEHRHSAHGKREYDEHDEWKDKNELAKKDGEIYEDRKRRGFPVEWQGVI